MKEKKKTYEALAKLVAEQYTAEGTKSTKIVDENGVSYTVGTRRSLKASVLAQNRDAVVAACREIGLDDMIVTDVNTSTLKSWLVEQMRPNGDESESFDYEAMPPELEGIVRLYEDVTVTVKKG